MSNTPHYDLACLIRKSLVNSAASVVAYNKEWGADYSSKHILANVESLKSSPSYFPIDPRLFTVQEMDELDFGTWSSSNQRLIPMWLLPFLLPDIEVTSISGKTVQGLENLDNDHRMGYLAYWVTPTNDQPSVQEIGIKIAVESFLPDYGSSPIQLYTRLEQDVEENPNITWNQIDYVTPWEPFEQHSPRQVLNYISDMADSVVSKLGHLEPKV